MTPLFMFWKQTPTPLCLVSATTPTPFCLVLEVTSFRQIPTTFVQLQLLLLLLFSYCRKPHSPLFSLGGHLYSLKHHWFKQDFAKVWSQNRTDLVFQVTFDKTGQISKKNQFLDAMDLQLLILSTQTILVSSLPLDLIKESWFQTEEFNKIQSNILPR